MGSLLSLAPLVASAAFPALGPLALAGIAGGGGLLEGILSGKGPVTSLGQGAIAGGTNFGLGKLGGLINDSSSIATNNTFGDPSQFTFSGLKQPNPLLTGGTFSMNANRSSLVDNLFNRGFRI